MTANLHKTRVAICSIVFLVFAAAAAWYQQPLMLLLPIVLLATILLIRYPIFLFYLLIVSIPWSFEFNLAPQLGTDLPDEPLMWVLSLVAIILLLRNRANFFIFRVHPLIILLWLQFLWIGCTLTTSTDTFLSFKYLLAKSWYLLAFVVAPYFFFQDEMVLKKSVLLLLVSMILFMLMTQIRHAFFNMSFSHVNDALYPFFRNHVNYSALLVCMIPILMALVQLQSSLNAKLLYGGLLMISIIALYFSYSRGAWLALVMGLCAFWLIKKGLLLFSFFLAITLVIATVFYFTAQDRYLKFSNDKNTVFHTNFREHLIATYQLKDLSNGERAYRWVAGIRMVSDNWQTGFGPSTFYSSYKNYTVPSFRTYVSKNEEHSTVHNYFLLLLIEQGAPGCLLFLALVGSLFWYIQRIYNHTTLRFWKVVMGAIAAILVMECTLNFLSDMIETDKIGSVFYLCVAVVLVADSKLSPNIQRIAQTITQ